MHDAAIAMLLLAPVGACTGDQVESTTDVALLHRAVEDLRIGVPDGRSEYMFGRVDQLAAADDGSVYVVDALPLSVRRYDGEGAYRATLGRVGEGPGEYRSIRGILARPDDTVAIRDVGSGRISLFSADGAFLHDFATGSHGGLLFGLDHEGNLYSEGRSADGETVLTQFSPEGAHVRDIALPEPRIEFAGPGRTFALVTTQGYLDPFPVRTLAAWSPLGYLLTGRNDRYEITVDGGVGGPVFARDVAAARLTGEERAEWEVWADVISDMYAAAGVNARVHPMPESKPFFRAVHTGDEGNVWVWRYVGAVAADPPIKHPEDGRPGLAWAEPPTFDVFAPTGRYLGTVVLPHHLRAMAFRGSTIWGVYTDEPGFLYVVRLRIEPPFE